MLRFFGGLAIILVGVVCAVSIACSVWLFFEERHANNQSAELHQDFVNSSNTQKALYVLLPLETANSSAANLSFQFPAQALNSTISIQEIRLLPSAGFPEIEAAVVLKSNWAAVPALTGKLVARLIVSNSDDLLKVNLASLDMQNVRLQSDNGFDMGVPRVITRIVSALGLFYLAHEPVAAFPSTFKFKRDLSASIPNFPAKIGGSGVTFGFSASPASLDISAGKFLVVGDGNGLAILASINSEG